jgi:signal peptide peptidase SppA
MNILDVLNAPWAITSEKLCEIHAIYAAHIRGDEIDIAAIEAKLGRPLDNSKSVSYKIVDGVAVIPVEGVISKRMNMFARISGGVSTQMLQGDISDAVNDPNAHSILLMIDSPGGSIDGLQQTADDIRAARDVKPVYALADGLMASAAYWIGSAADKVFSASDTTAVGSIGVIAKHADYSKAQEMEGVKVTDIYAGKYKAVGSPNAPLTTEGRATIQAQLDHAYSVFVDAVAKNRGVDAKTVLDKMADGRVFFGKQAVDAGLVDGMSNASDLITQLNQIKNGQPAHSRGGASASVQTGEKAMTLVIAGVNIETQAALDAAISKITADSKAEGVKSGAAAECVRIKAVEAAAEGFPGHDELVAKLKFDGTTTGDQAATQILSAEKKLRGEKLKDIKADAPKAANASDPGNAAGDKDKDKKKDPYAIASKITDYRNAEAKKGNIISFAQAEAHVEKNG